MRSGLALLVASVGLAACSGGADPGPDTPEIDSVEPAFGSLTGGSRIVITGSGFNRSGAPPNHVLIGGREAPLAAAIDDEHLEVVVPPGETAGPADIVVFNDNGHASADGLFNYSTSPTISAVSPAIVSYRDGGTVTVTGSGFLDENAGPVTVYLDGEPVVDVDVASDTSLTFTAPPGIVLREPDLTIENDRGLGDLADAYKYGAGGTGGLVVWPRFDLNNYAAFFDPVSLDVQIIPHRVRGGGGGDIAFWHAVVTDADGRRIGHRGGSQFMLEEVDADEQTQTLLRFTNVQIAEMERVGSTIYAIDRNRAAPNPRFGTYDLSTGVFTGIGNAAIAGNALTLAADSVGTMYITHGSPTNLATINRTSGALGAPIAITPQIYPIGMRFLGSTLYVATRDGGIYTLNTSNGNATFVMQVSFPIGSLEVTP